MMFDASFYTSLDVSIFQSIQRRENERGNIPTTQYTARRSDQARDQQALKT